MRELLLKHLNLPIAAVNWLMMGFETMQTFDDFADGNEVNKERLDVLIWDTMVSMPLNTFYVKNQAVLMPLITITILKWHAANMVERKHDANAMSFAWRAGFYDIILLVCTLCHGYVNMTDKAHLVMQLYGESYENYIQEVNNA